MFSKKFQVNFNPENRMLCFVQTNSVILNLYVFGSCNDHDEKHTSSLKQV